MFIYIHIIYNYFTRSEHAFYEHTLIISCASGNCVPGCLWNTFTMGLFSLSLVERSELATGPCNVWINMQLYNEHELDPEMLDIINNWTVRCWIKNHKFNDIDTI